MAASVYATPPPDLSSEDTALSDVSNSSQISSSSSQSKAAAKRNIAAVLSGSHSSTSSTTSTSNAVFDSNQNDQSKKRRKQSTPIRISAINLSADIAAKIESETLPTSGTGGVVGVDGGSVVSESGAIDIEQKIPKQFIPILEEHQQKARQLQLQPVGTTFDILQTNISSLTPFKPVDDLIKSHGLAADQDDEELPNASDFDRGAGNDGAKGSDESSQVPHSEYKECEQCGERFDSDIKFGVHILQHHAPSSTSRESNDELMNDVENISTKIKIEPDLNECGTGDGRLLGSLPRPEDWLKMTSLNFPFPPEAAAAALSASNYLSQLPLLSVPPVGPFPSVEGLSRPPLRIFNPEAYCDLCNKEFCNKYFLKTHKANKHGIYDPANPAGDSPATNQINQISQALQMQFQQQQHQAQQSLQQQQQQQQAQQQAVVSQPSGQLDQQPSGTQIGPPEIAVYCDICHKRFTNVFAMKRHRNKAHEIPRPGSPNQTKSEVDNSPSSNDKENTTPLRMPDIFREDFAIEQEDVSFTPQPRKLSPASSQQARDANFSVEKLKRLGVVNPEAFCDLCCKEYCNKYFLRTHKLKRHGVYVPLEDGQNDKFPWQFVQTTPLNLMVGGSEKLRRKSIDSDSSGKVQIKAEIEDSVPGKFSDDQDVNTKDSSRQHEFEKLAQVEESSVMQQADPDAISIDLQKLQSMILQLNDLSNQRPVACHFCGKQLENQYLLHAHITTEHAVDNNNLAAKSPRSRSPSISGVNQGEVCKQCDKDFPNLIELKQHIFETHGLPLNSPVREGFITPERPVSTTVNLPTTPTQSDRRPPYTITPTSSYCEICNKELCNKYFMKTHMQRMHGIEIENGAQIGGVVCNICNKELCSKYFLRVHKHNTHGIVEEGSPLPQSRQNGEQPDAEGVPPFPIDPSIKTDLADLSTRYFTHYTEVCPLCSRRFRSSKWLRAHLMSDHGKTGTEKLRELEQQMSFSKSSSPTLKIPNGGLNINNLDPNLLTKGAFPTLIMNEEAISTSPRLKEYQCSICSFSTPYYAFLFIHERSHSFISNPPPATTSSLKSENAVSIAKDQQRLAQPSSVATSSGTPTITPASTPVPQTPQENANGNKRESEKERERERERDRQYDREPITVNSLGDLANISSRPTSYAIPQQNVDCEMMQSFFIEEIILDSSGNTASSQNNGSKSNTGNGEANNTNGGGSAATVAAVSATKPSTIESSKSNENSMTGNSGNRFVPALVFLPVRERISGPITVSFTLTPA